MGYYGLPEATETAQVLTAIRCQGIHLVLWTREPVNPQWNQGFLKLGPVNLPVRKRAAPVNLTESGKQKQQTGRRTSDTNCTNFHKRAAMLSYAGAGSRFRKNP